MEQCTSETVARYHADLLSRFGAMERGYDLTGGFGVDARFLATRCRRFVYCERDEELARIAAHNFEAFGESAIETQTGNGIEILDREAEPIDFVFVDPARRDARHYKVSAFEDCEPNLLEHWAALRERTHLLMVKASPGLDLSLGVSQLPGVSEVHVIAVDNECKELLFVSDRNSDCANVVVRCVDLNGRGGAETFDFTLAEEAALEAAVDWPKRYLYEPNAAILKAGAFKSIARRFGLAALHPRTRLYSSEERLDDFPGRVLEIQGQGQLSAKTARRLFPDRQANVISRNSGLTADALRRKLGLKDGGERFAVGATLADGGRQLFACRLALR